MIRQPTAPEQALDWHRRRLSGGAKYAVINVNYPQCGWFKCRLVKGGPWVPARIWIDRVLGDLTEFEFLQCDVNGSECDPADEWLLIAKNPITESEWLRMTAAIEGEPT